MITQIYIDSDIVNCHDDNIINDDDIRLELTNSLILALYNNDIEAINDILIHKKFNVNCYSNGPLFYGRPLYYACNMGNVEVVKLLLKQPNINTGYDCYQRNTPLCTAVMNCHIEVVKLLLTDGRVNVNEQNSNDCTPLHIACGLSSTQSLSTSSSSTQSSSTLNDTIGVDMIKLLLSKSDIIVNINNNMLWTPLFYAVYEKKLDVINLLLPLYSKINISHIDLEGKTLLDIAGETEDLSVINLVNKLVLNSLLLDINIM